MLTNIRGLVARLKLATSLGMMPLYEAVSNSIDAIADNPPGGQRGKIVIRLIRRLDLAAQGGDRTYVIDGFEIEDNGIGLDRAHMDAFKEAHTLSKAKLGGKGLGRFTYLKVFSHVELRSTFLDESSRFERRFKFTIDHGDIGADDLLPTASATGTTVRMTGLEDRYRAAWPSDPELVAKRVVEHFLIRFASRNCPAVTVEADEHSPINLQSLFDSTIFPHIKERLFDVAGHQFSLQAFRHKDGRSHHKYVLCATGREVAAAKLKELLPELPERFVDHDHVPFALIVLVTGEYIDDHANWERTSVAFQADGEFELDNVLVSRQALNKGISSTLRELLVGDLSTTHEEKLAQISRFVEHAPEYRVLTHDRYRTLLEQRVEPGLRDEQLDEVLLRLRREVEDGVRKEERHIAAMMDKVAYDQYEERIQNLMVEMNEVGKSKLSAYIAHRRTILDLVDNNLKQSRSNGKYPLERVLHNMIFPMGYNSKDIFLEQQNLWLIDERLCFHTLLTSDSRLSGVPGLKGTSRKEPDIFAFFYDTPIGIAEPDNLSGGGVVIIEFKRPGKDNYDRDPADQIVQRFVEIKGGGVVDIDGLPINPQGLRYTGYLIADLTPSLRKHVAMRYHSTNDKEGYFFTLPDGDGYIEIISYPKLVRDAKRRNRVLFEKLGLHKH